MVGKHLVRCGLGAALLFGMTAPVMAQRQDQNQYYKNPETAAELWRYMNHEIALGQFNLAAQYLKTFVAKNPTDEELLQIQEKDGSSAFMRLLMIPGMEKDAKPLVDRVGQLVQKHLTDPVRLRKFIRDLSTYAGDPREIEFAINQLRRAGAAAVPPLVSVLLSTADRAPEHSAVIDALMKLDKSATLPLSTALAVDNQAVRSEIIDMLRKRADAAAVPYLWYYSAAADQLPAIRARAQQAIASLLGTSPDSLPQAKDALTKEAEKFYQHKVELGGVGGPVNVWRWDGKGLVSLGLRVPDAEEYYGLFFAGQALRLDPAYEPAQVVFLSLALDKAVERTGIDQPFAKAGEVAHLLTSVNPDLVTAVLRKALAERRTSVILGATRALGEMAESKAAQPEPGGTPALFQALNYPDRRVQAAAADAILRMPRPVFGGASRVLEVLRRLASTDASAKVLLIDNNIDRANLVMAGLQKAGYQVVIANTGKAGLQRLTQSADIDAIVVDSGAVDPQLPNLIPQLRADIDVGRLPIIVMAPAQSIPDLTRRFEGVVVIPQTTDAPSLKSVLSKEISNQSGQPLSDVERKEYAALAMTWLSRIARGEVAGYDVRPFQAAILQGLTSKDLALLAIDGAGSLPSPEAQRQLAKLVLDGDLAAPLRSAAARNLTQNIQHFGLHLTAEQVGALKLLLESTADAKLKGSIAAVVGASRPDASQTGQRLQRYVPVFSPAPQPNAPAPQPKPDANGAGEN
jgi:CheY-like chemotaxis protein